MVELAHWETDLPIETRREALGEGLSDWIRAESLSNLAEAWHAKPPRSDSTNELFQWYEVFSSKHWDFRGGRERDFATKPDLTERQTSLAFAAASDLGLKRARPPKRTHYDFTLILGGLVRACVTRPRYAYELGQAGLSLGQVSALGGYRALSADEQDLASRLEIVADNEFNAMIQGLKGAFHITGDPQIQSSSQQEPRNADWAVAAFGSSDIEVIAAPSTDPTNRRANTADTFLWWSKRVENLEGSHILLITSPIYVPYQGAISVQHLAMPHRVTVETVGISDTAADLEIDTQVFTAANYLQEIRSAITGYATTFRQIQ